MRSSVFDDTLQCHLVRDKYLVTTRATISSLAAPRRHKEGQPDRL